MRAESLEVHHYWVAVNPKGPSTKILGNLGPSGSYVVTLGPNYILLRYWDPQRKELKFS